MASTTPENRKSTLTMSLETLRTAPQTSESDTLAAKIEPFDSFWEGPADIQKGFDSFGKFYRANYLPYVPASRSSDVQERGTDPAGRAVNQDRLPG